ncbi:hypothetical protein A6U87_05955 [Rhizobium sp. AC44/96]|uniref:hypothetical protein n=1 Tax=Rhizobium sp. AC44/96 TaxID=1841654 RepID=UPI00080FB30A|nr:hypothetical protein [Rhizobium sp. AC44/96]OCJ12856.1 hypothetical protein A6U87_05955 [Rhizobium sp. AC44/96]
MDELKTEAARMAEEYLRLGGTRRAKIDDNLVSVRKWDDEPAEAQAFWDEMVEPLSKERQDEIVTLLPTINTP